MSNHVRIKSNTIKSLQKPFDRRTEFCLREQEITNVPIMTLAGMFITHEPHVFVGWANSFIVCPRGAKYKKPRGHKSVPTLPPIAINGISVISNSLSPDF